MDKKSLSFPCHEYLLKKIHSDIEIKTFIKVYVDTMCLQNRPSNEILEGLLHIPLQRETNSA